MTTSSDTEDHDDTLRWRHRASDVVGKRIREVREQRGLSVPQLATRCAEIGDPGLTKSALFNIESGRRDGDGRRRRDVTVDELLTVAYALDVAPVHLLVPLDESAWVKQGNYVAYTEIVRAWIRGYHTLPGTDEQKYFNETPHYEWIDPTVKNLSDSGLLTGIAKENLVREVRERVTHEIQNLVHESTNRGTADGS